MAKKFMQVYQRIIRELSSHWNAILYGLNVKRFNRQGIDVYKPYTVYIFLMKMDRRTDIQKNLILESRGC